MASNVITILTDFGLRDPYVAEMKAVILSICPYAIIVDVSHDVEKFNIRMGSYILASACPFFQKGAINIAVVDPAVGTERQGLCIETEHGFFVGPDNGLLALAVRVQRVKHIYVIANSKFFLSRVSPTFHGRDVFAPVAAHLANGVDPSDLGPKTEDMVIPSFAKIVRCGSKIAGEVMYVDGFGNVITNISEKDIKCLEDVKELAMKVGNRETKIRFCKTYGDVGAGQLLAVISSHGFLEISMNQGNASKTLRLKSEDKITVCL